MQITSFQEEASENLPYHFDTKKLLTCPIKTVLASCHVEESIAHSLGQQEAAYVTKETDSHNNNSSKIICLVSKQKAKSDTDEGKEKVAAAVVVGNPMECSINLTS